MSDGGGAEHLTKLEGFGWRGDPEQHDAPRRGIALPRRGYTAIQTSGPALPMAPRGGTGENLALRHDLEREEIKAALLGEGPAEQLANALVLLGALAYRLRETLDAEDAGLLEDTERRLGVALKQLRARNRGDIR